MHSLRIFLYLTLLCILCNSCDNGKKKVEQPPPEEIHFIAPLGKKISASLFSSLKGELKAAMQEGGVENAISVCNIKALNLTDSVALASSFHVSIKRTSNKIRNPRNAPDEEEQLALDLYTQLVEAGEEWPDFYIQKITRRKKVEYNFYKPMKMESLCLICHGDNTTLAPNATKVINELYPEDGATGYKEGDFRGLIRIKFYEPHL